MVETGLVFIIFFCLPTVLDILLSRERTQVQTVEVKDKLRDSDHPLK